MINSHIFQHKLNKNQFTMQTFLKKIFMIYQEVKVKIMSLIQHLKNLVFFNEVKYPCFV